LTCLGLLLQIMNTFDLSGSLVTDNEHF
jgi:hypothetical protein